MFQYKCVGCGSRATKPPVEKKDQLALSGTLGTWRCTGHCKGKVKVKREKKANV